MPENLDSLRELLAFGFINEVEFERRSEALGAPPAKENQYENKSQSPYTSKTSSPYSSLQNSSEFVFVNKYDIPVADNSSNLSNSYMFSNNYGSGYHSQETPSAAATVNYDRYGQIADNGLHSSWFMVNSGSTFGEDSADCNSECEPVNDQGGVGDEFVSDEDKPISRFSLFGMDENDDLDQIVIEKVYDDETAYDSDPSPTLSTFQSPEVEEDTTASVFETSLTSAPSVKNVVKSSSAAPVVYTNEELDLVQWIKTNMFQIHRDISLGSHSRGAQCEAACSQQMHSAEFYSAFYDDLESVYQDEHELYIPEPKKTEWKFPGPNFRRRQRRMTLAVMHDRLIKWEEVLDPLAWNYTAEDEEDDDDEDDYNNGSSLVPTFVVVNVV